MNFKRHDLPIEAGSRLACLTAQRGRAGDVQTETTLRHRCGYLARVWAVTAVQTSRGRADAVKQTTRCLAKHMLNSL
ncbi:MAG: hypothetical protein IT422_16775 [Pirellulaceae bacterium]|nr:hypothetical protein [Pirellulaceae bacterium]